MTLKADSRKRVVVPDAQPGDVFDYEDRGNGRYLLVRLAKPSPKSSISRAEFRKAISRSKLKFEVGWDELRTLTREP